MSLIATSWKLATSEEKSGTALATVAIGKLYFENTSTKDKLTIKYRAVGIGAGKGPPLGANWSSTSNPSGSFSNVGVTSAGKNFETAFPCHGYMIGVGASAGLVGSILGMDIAGGGLTAVLFGIIPVWGGVRLWGAGNGTTPGAGFTVALAVFEEDTP